MKTKTLKQSFEECIDKLCNACEDFPWDNKEAYVNWLAQTYYFVRHTTSFLALSSAYYGPTRRDDHYKMIEHLNEELNHDKLAFEDIKGLGYDLKDLPELPETSAFYQSQYYYIQYEGPSALYGYALALEGLSAKAVPQLAEAAKKIYGIKATRFLKLHAVVDIDHFAHGLENIDTLDPKDHGMVLRNLYQSTELYILMLERIKKEAAKAEIPMLKSA